jgi:hypothetical protein
MMVWVIVVSLSTLGFSMYEGLIVSDMMGGIEEELRWTW